MKKVMQTDKILLANKIKIYNLLYGKVIHLMGAVNADGADALELAIDKWLEVGYDIEKIISAKSKANYTKELYKDIIERETKTIDRVRAERR
jgi:methenyltetrahydromethanopterin cyclohydrolase